MRSFENVLQELRRRKVYRALAWYTAAAFAVWQAADIAFPVLGFPPVAMTLLVVGAIAGFPVVVGLSWAFDVRRDSSAGEEARPRAAARPAAIGIVAGLLTFGGLGVWISATNAPPELEDDLPLPTLTQVTFTGTAGGAAGSATLSPDGQFVAYTDGEPPATRLLVQDLTSDGPPADLGRFAGKFTWSADGSEVLTYGFLEQGEVLTRGLAALPRLGGVPRVMRALEGGGRVAFPGVLRAGDDGACLYGVTQPGDAVECQRLDGSERVDTLPLDPPPGAARGLAISGDGEHVLADVRSPGGEEALYLLSTAGRPPSRLLDGGASAGVWEGASTVFVSRRAADGVEVVRLDLDLEERTLAGRPVRVWSGESIREFDLARGGDRMVYLATRTRSHVWLYRDGEETALTSGTARDGNPAVDPVHERVAFTRRGDIYIVADGGGSPDRLTNLDAGSPGALAWSTDGARLALRLRSDSTEEVAVIDVARRSVRRRPSPFPEPVRVLAWVPGADTLIAITSERPMAGFSVHELALDHGTDGAARELYTGEARLEPGLAVSPDGREVALAVSFGMSPITLVSRADGSTRNLTFRCPEGCPTPARMTPGAPVAWSADGEIFVESFDRSVPLIAVDAATGSARAVLQTDEDCRGHSIAAGAARVACLATERSTDVWRVDHLRWGGSASAR